MIKKIVVAWRHVQVLFCRYFGRTYHCKCGHTCKKKTHLSIEGHEGVFAIRSKNPEYCPQCWQQAAIRCAWCEEVILPGDAITLYTPKKGVEVPEHARVYKREPHLQLVGCLRWNCAQSGIDRAGFWVMPGKVQRVMSPMEMLFANGSDDVIICNDLTDLSQAILVSDEGLH